MLRPLLITLGLLFVGLAGLGVVLPGLPTTPFLLLAAACFARSSERFYNWLLRSRVFGPLIRDWRERRSMPLRAKVTGLLMVGVAGATSVWVLDDWRWRVLVLVLLLCPVAILLRIRTTPGQAGVPEES